MQTLQQAFPWAAFETLEGDVVAGMSIKEQVGYPPSSGVVVFGNADMKSQKSMCAMPMKSLCGIIHAGAEQWAAGSIKLLASCRLLLACAGRSSKPASAGLHALHSKQAFGTNFSSQSCLLVCAPVRKTGL